VVAVEGVDEEGHEFLVGMQRGVEGADDQAPLAAAKADLADIPGLFEVDHAQGHGGVAVGTAAAGADGFWDIDLDDHGCASLLVNSATT
jgi:hypothetical protein